MKKSSAVLLPLSVSAKTPKNEELIAEYRRLDDEGRRIEAELKNIKEEVLKRLEAVGQKWVQSNRGAFSVITKTTYAYSVKVKEAEIKLKALKETEEETGKATPKESKYVKFDAQNFIRE